MTKQERAISNHLYVTGNHVMLHSLYTRWRHSLVFFCVDVETQCVHTQTQFRALLVLYVKVVNAVHLEILGYLQVLHHSFLPTMIKR